MAIQARLNTRRGKKILAKGNARYVAAAPVEKPKAQKPKPKPKPKVEEPVAVVEAPAAAIMVEEEAEVSDAPKKKGRKPKAD